MVTEQIVKKIGGMAKRILKVYLIKEDIEAVKMKKKIFCISQRQWALLLSTIYLIISGVLTILGCLVARHNTDVLNMILGDFEHERSKHNCHDPLTLNEQKLVTSEQHMREITDTLDRYMWISYIHLLSTFLLCFGVGLRYNHLILQWIINSGLMFVTASILVLAFFHDAISTSYWDNSLTVIYCTLAPFWMATWYFLISYWREERKLKKIEARQHSVIKSHGGLTHIIGLPNQNLK